MAEIFTAFGKTVEKSNLIWFIKKNKLEEELHGFQFFR